MLVTAGTLIFDDYFRTAGWLDFSGGKIKVKTDQTAVFSDPLVVTATAPQRGIAAFPVTR